MSPEIARAITILSVIVTVVAVGFAIYTALRPSRVRVRRDTVILAISISTVLALGLIMKIRTPMAFLVVALLFGAILGLVQGMRLQMEDRQGQFFARRDILGVGAWGVGLAITQFAGLASRTGVIEIGQAVSIFGIAATGTLLATRQRELVQARKLTAAGTAVAALLPLPVLVGLAFFQQPTPEPPPLVYRGEIVWQDVRDDVLNLGSLSIPGEMEAARAGGYDLTSDYYQSNVDVVFDQVTGEVTAAGALEVGWPAGELNLMLATGIADFLDGEVSEEDEAEIEAARAERHCTVLYSLSFSGGPVAYAGTGNLELPVDITLPPDVVTDCTFWEASGSSDTFVPGTTKLVLAGLGAEELTGEVRGSYVLQEDNQGLPQFAWPFAAFTETEIDDEEEPNPAGSESSGEAGGEDDDELVADEEDDDEHEDSQGCDCGDEEEVSDEEAAGAAVAGAIGAGAVAATAVAGAAAGGAAGPGGGGSGGPGGNGRAPDRARSGSGRRPEGAPPEGDPDGERKIDNVRTAASNRGMDDVLERLDTLGRNPDGSPNHDALDQMRDIIRNRVSRDNWEQNSDLMQSSGAGDFARGARDTVASGFDKVAEVGDAIHNPILSAGGRIGGMATRNPVAAGKVVISVALPPAGIAIGVADVGAEIYDRATSPGDETLSGAASEIGWIAAREGAAEIVGAGIGAGLGAIARGVSEGVETGIEQVARQSDEAAEAMARQGGDAGASAASREGTEQATETAARQGDEAAEAATDGAARQGDEAATTATRQGDEAAEAATEGASRQGDEAATTATRQGDETAEAATEGATRQGDEAATTGTRQGDDGAEAATEGAARQGDEAAEAATEGAARQGDEAATATRQGDEAAEAATEGATRQGDEAATSGTRQGDEAADGATRQGDGTTEATADGASRQGDDAAEATADGASRQTDDAVEGTADGASRQSDDAAEATADGASRQGDDAAEATADGASRQGDDAAEATADGASRQSDDAVEGATDNLAGRPDGPGGSTADDIARQTDDVAGAATGGERVDDSWLKESPHGTKVPPENINQAGWTLGEAEELRRIAREEKVIIGARTTNVDSLSHPKALPKTLDVKGKTLNDLDVQLGAQQGDQGLAAMFEPKHPGYDASPELLDRYWQRMEEYGKLKDKLPALKKKGIFWDEASGLFKNAAGTPYRGDIDLVYIKDAETGQILTGERYDEVVEKLKKSGAQIQHGAEVNSVRDISNMGGSVDGAMGLHGTLSGNHMAGAETVIETSAGGWQKGASSTGMFDSYAGSGNPLLERGIPMELPE